MNNRDYHHNFGDTNGVLEREVVAQLRMGHLGQTSLMARGLLAPKWLVGHPYRAQLAGEP